MYARLACHPGQGGREAELGGDVGRARHPYQGAVPGCPPMC